VPRELGQHAYRPERRDPGEGAVTNREAPISGTSIESRLIRSPPLQCDRLFLFRSAARTARGCKSGELEQTIREERGLRARHCMPRPSVPVKASLKSRAHKSSLGIATKLSGFPH